MPGTLTTARKPKGQRELIYDVKSGSSAVYSRIANLGYTGVLVELDELDPVLSPTVKRFVQVKKGNGELKKLRELAKDRTQPMIVTSRHLGVLAKARMQQMQTCYRAFVDDAKSLHESVQKGCQHEYLMVSFRDPTNIPLELVIASLQSSGTVLIKEIMDPTDHEDALVTLRVLEVGADGVVYSPKEHDQLDQFLSKLELQLYPEVMMQTGTVTRCEPVGMGYRGCVDLATLFTETEGILVGSTSQGGILCCPEVFHLPYMDLRPFRVNAGAVHSYVFNLGNRTNYITELRAGSEIMVVDLKGKVRKAHVGRVKTEVRPLRLIEAKFDGGQLINIMLQDDWHVRIYSDKGTPLNISEIRPGQKVLGMVANPGRHVGIQVEEKIFEN